MFPGSYLFLPHYTDDAFLFRILSLIFLSNMLIRADAPVMGTLWEFIMAGDNEIG